jgi:hypothetical protein
MDANESEILFEQAVSDYRRAPHSWSRALGAGRR